jgi:hypothetical protein
VNKGSLAMSLKSFVNNKAEWDAFLEFIDSEIGIYHKGLEQVDNTVDIYRMQGCISALRKLKYLRDKVNG